MDNFYSKKKVLVTGGTGLIGRPLVARLVALGAHVTVVSLDQPFNLSEGIKFVQGDLREFSQALRVAEGMDYVFQLAGVKGSPQMTATRPASFFVPTSMFNLNMMEAARQQSVKRYLFTSSIGVYSPAEIFYEDEVWKTFPSPNDRFAGWAKRMGELQAEAYKIEYQWDGVSIVRPANVYGPHDNFDPNNAMVIPSLINRAMSGENPLSVWGDGSAIRDFIYADDVAAGMLAVLEQGISEPINLGSGIGVSIKDIVQVIQNHFPGLNVTWDVSKPSGDKKRLMDVGRAQNYGISPKVNIEQGIAKTIEWFKTSSGSLENRYNAFTEDKLLPKL